MGAPRISAAITRMVDVPVRGKPESVRESGRTLIGCRAVAGVFDFSAMPCPEFNDLTAVCYLPITVIVKFFKKESADPVMEKALLVKSIFFFIALWGIATAFLWFRPRIEIFWKIVATLIFGFYLWFFWKEVNTGYASFAGNWYPVTIDFLKSWWRSRS